MTELQSGFFSTSDGQHLKYQTNFQLFEHDKNLPVILFNYGLVCSEFHWKYQISYFIDKYPIIIHDYRGHYESTGKDELEKLNIPQIAKDTYELLVHLEVERAITVGHSMGSNVSIEMALSYPQKIQALCLISGSIFSAREVMLDSNIMDILTPYLDLFNNKYPKLFDLIWKSSQFNPLMTDIIHKGGFNIKTVSKEFVNLYLKKLGQLGPGIFLQLFKSMSEHCLTLNLDKIDCPTLVISGDSDKVIPHYTQNYIIEKIKNCESYILRNGSHVPQVDFPELVNKRLELFIQDTQKAV